MPFHSALPSLPANNSLESMITLPQPTKLFCPFKMHYLYYFQQNHENLEDVGVPLSNIPLVQKFKREVEPHSV